MHLVRVLGLAQNTRLTEYQKTGSKKKVKDGFKYIIDYC